MRDTQSLAPVAFFLFHLDEVIPPRKFWHLPMNPSFLPSSLSIFLPFLPFLPPPGLTESLNLILPQLSRFLSFSLVFFPLNNPLLRNILQSHATPSGLAAV